MQIDAGSGWHSGIIRVRVIQLGRNIGNLTVHYN